MKMGSKIKILVAFTVLVVVSIIIILVFFYFFNSFIKESGVI